MTLEHHSVDAERGMGAVMNSISEGFADVFRFLKAATLVAIAVALAVFAVQNMAIVEVQFVNWSVSAPRSAIIFAIFAVGGLFGLIGATFLRRRPGRR